MALKRVTITSDVYFGCVAHALTTEREEIMGLLLGDIDVRRRLPLSTPWLQSHTIQQHR